MTTPADILVKVHELAARMGVSPRAASRYLRRRDVLIERIGKEDCVWLSNLVRQVPELRDSEELARLMRAA
jgi:hypothetical protein